MRASIRSPSISRRIIDNGLALHNALRAIDGHLGLLLRWSVALRASPLPSYPIGTDELRRMHGNDERVSVESLRQGTEMLFRTLKRVAGSGEGR